MCRAASAPLSAKKVDGVSTDSLVGQLIDGKYAVHKLIGEGGMGKVYAGTNIRTESPVAIKTLLPELVRDDTVVKRFEIEAKAASNLHHPNTIRIFDFGSHDGMLFMIMELLDGASLEGTLRREGFLEPRRVIRLMRQVLRSLAEAHGVGLVHRDLKPDNIFLNRAGGEEDFVKVLDFGVAKLKDNKYGNATLTQAGMIFGTPTYMSPEQARAQEIDGRSDIYALGVILYECLTGDPPFKANDPVAVLIQHVNEPPPPFAVTNPHLSPMPEFEAIVMRCLRKAREERFDTVTDLLGALDELEQLYATGQTTVQADSALVSGNTVALPRGAGHPSPGRGTQVHPSNPGQDSDRLGLGDGGVRDFTIGAQGDTQFGERVGDAPSRSGPSLGLLAAIVAVVVAVAGGLVYVLLFSTTPQVTSAPGALEASSAPVANAGTEEPVGGNERPVLPNSEAQNEIASLRIRAALEPSVRASTDAVVVFELVETNGVAATVRVADADEPLGVLPYRFVHLRGPDDPEEVRLQFSAEGFNDEELRVPLRTAERHEVTLRRRRAPGTNRNRPSNNRLNTGPLDNVYGP